MKRFNIKSNIYFLIILVFYPYLMASDAEQDSWIRINQLGYPPNFTKIAVWVTKSDKNISEFSIHDYNSNKLVWHSKDTQRAGSYGPFTNTYRLDFSSFRDAGTYYLSAGGATSGKFRISGEVYDGTADYLLNYMRQQRCGFNPFLKDSCHLQDGYTIYGPMPDGTRVDVTGGWHDASDYLQYLTTSATATINLLLAYRDFPFSFQDRYNASGLSGANGEADISDEAMWGLQWLEKMNPDRSVMFNQIADDRDHQGFRLPTKDSVRYGDHPGRPVYFCTGDPQGLFKHKNRSTGLASTAGKYASAFALAANIYAGKQSFYKRKSIDAFKSGLKNPGVCQTAPGRAEYFYEEDNWADDMELAAAELWQLTGEEKYLDDVYRFAAQEPVTPWMGSDTARHYQWYPFINWGHHEAARSDSPEINNKLITYYKQGLERIWQRGKDNAFRMGVPFIWCSNNLVAALATQSFLYRTLSGDSSYLEMETAMRDWLFGCNPWGGSMVIGLPKDGVYAHDPHSSLSHLHNYQLSGGLLDGPVYQSIYDRQKYVHLTDDDEYFQFQSELAVYHDDVGDYVTNEPTMDGTASLVYYLAAMQNQSHRLDEVSQYTNFSTYQGAITRGDSTKKNIALVFTGDEYADGADTTISVLEKHGIKASFFLTGNFYRNKKFLNIIERLIQDGHYLGAHSDQHLLYCEWDDRQKLKITKSQFLQDLHKNYMEMQKFGIDEQEALYYLPPFEWYNQSISDWTSECGLQLINYSPGTLSHADYTTPSMGKSYISSDKIIDSIFQFEEISSTGLNGFILLMHTGMGDERSDKLYNKLDSIIHQLNNLGYSFVRIDQLLKTTG